MESELLYRYFDGATTPDEERQIMQWAEASPENYRRYLAERQLWSAVVFHASRQPVRRTLWRRVAAWRVSGAAACILLLVGLAGLFFVGRLFPDGRMQRVVVPAGQRVELLLSDGTKVWLNSRSRLEYPASFGRGSRRVTLSGEGYFEVTHDRSKPFVVETAEFDVRVLGTTFNVYAYDNDRATFETALLEGSVEVASRSDATQRLVLRPDEAAVLSAGGRLMRTQVTDKGRFRWTEGLISLNDVPFGELLTRFSDYFDIRILLKNPKLYDVRCTGKFRQSDGIDYSLHVLQRFVNFSFTHDEERRTIEIR
ncbi:FecR family protein [Alistipes sp.]|uniref:FecR family protein n=1 Tax=Alistipes sp. TaxID=1872444 RepID=UPI003A89AD92